MCGIFLIALFFILEHPRFLLFNKKDLPAALKTLESVSMYSPSEKLQEAKEILR